MSDVKCVVCGEPWDAYGARHGDMNKWEYELFKQGAGCPACEGVEPEEPWHPESLEDIENGDEDPIDRLYAYQKRNKRPVWQRPEAKVLWECAGCGVQVVRDPDYDKLEFYLPRGAKAREWYHSHRFNDDEAEETPAHVFEPGIAVCPYCLDKCTGCGRPVCGNLDFGDSHDDGWCSTLEGYGYSDAFCIDCVESSCCKCGRLHEECDCCAECGEAKWDCGCGEEDENEEEENDE